MGCALCKHLQRKWGEDRKRLRNQALPWRKKPGEACRHPGAARAHRKAGGYRDKDGSTTGPVTVLVVGALGMRHCGQSFPQSRGMPGTASQRPFKATWKSLMLQGGWLGNEGHRQGNSKGTGMAVQRTLHLGQEDWPRG